MRKVDSEIARRGEQRSTYLVMQSIRDSFHFTPAQERERSGSVQMNQRILRAMPILLDAISTMALCDRHRPRSIPGGYQQPQIFQRSGRIRSLHFATPRGHRHQRRTPLSPPDPKDRQHGIQFSSSDSKNVKG